MSNSVRLIMHLDMDAFFASVEQQQNPMLRGKPVIVGGDPSGRGVVSTCSYEAREYGVHSAMPSREAMRKCPQAIFLPVNMKAYSYASDQVMTILDQYSPVVEAVSIDEAFIELTGLVTNFDEAAKLACKVKREILAKLELTCSVGIASTKHIAKIASDLEKPDGLTCVRPEHIEKLIYPLPVNRIWGVGPVTYENLQKHGILTIGDLARMAKSDQLLKLGRQSVRLAELARGVDNRQVFDSASRTPEKSISHEHTLTADIDDLDTINALILSLADKVVTRMKRGGWLARKVSLKLRWADFNTITRDQTLTTASADLNLICETARSLVPVDKIPGKKVRLIGVRVSNLKKQTDSRQIELYDEYLATKSDKLADVIEQLRERFGYDIISWAGANLFSESSD